MAIMLDALRGQKSVFRSAGSDRSGNRFFTAYEPFFKDRAEGIEQRSYQGRTWGDTSPDLDAREDHQAATFAIEAEKPGVGSREKVK